MSGTVTFDGEPLPNALVSFYHEDDRPSHGKTDASGLYELTYMADRPGAIVGKNVVRITVATVEGEGVAPQKELIPAMYNVDSELTVDVQPGSNADVDFDLKKSGGPG
ncbi:carboxypeptidase-like regulatory domain-containing protein [Rosistilla carotiformis]|uniref:carboxypeptidase-like regulatory domain-containing protein n=1 Tax=Rosistilla carotiformis TaxID=2528017 RepID=UPI0011AAEBE4|nr:carboxypeptidase-like regulatory domain-containing protein [Rosistilla carotiformis]